MCPETTKLVLVTLVLILLLLSSCSSRQPPPTTLPPTDKLPRSMKGYELYSWQVGTEWYFSLSTATNRLKTYDEITAGETTLDPQWTRLVVHGTHNLEATLEQIPPGTLVVWMGPKTLKRFGSKPRDLVLPPSRTVRAIEAYCQELDIRLQVEQ